jgi:hypothetical protein
MTAGLLGVTQTTDVRLIHGGTEHHFALGGIQE